MKRNKKTCEKCTREISSSNYLRHINSCRGIRKTEEIKIGQLEKENGLYICPFCSKQYNKFGIGTHIWRNHTPEGRKLDPLKKLKDGKIKIWNKGLNKNNDQRVKNGSSKLKEKYKNGEIIAYMKGKKHKPETIEKMRQTNGGLRFLGGRGKKGWYKGFWCDSSFELVFVIYNLENRIKFKRNTTESFQYEFNGKKYNWFPDFIMEDQSFVEIKGYEDLKTLEKYKSFPNDKKLKVLKYNDLKYAFDYVISKYGNDFIKLYEYRSLKEMKNK